MNTIYLTEEQLKDILTTLYICGLIDLNKASVDVQYTTERIKMYLEAKAVVENWLNN